jgi:LEA14-like dessication related protein
MTRKLAIVLSAAALLSSLLLAACASTQDKDASGEVGVKLRRVDITTATFDAMELSIVVLVQNGTNADVGVGGGEGSLKIVGPAEDEEGDEGDVDAEAEGGEAADDEDGEDEDEEEGDDDDEDEDDADEGADTSGIVTDEWFSGKAAGGSCAAFSECEITIPVTLPLPKDSEALERLLEWQRMTVETKGTLKIGQSSETWGGPREIATPLLPKPILEEAQIASVDEGVKGTAFFKLGIDNPNVFQVKVDGFTWGVTVGGKVMREPGEASWENVPASSVASFEDSVQLDEETFGKEVRKLLSEPSVSYVIEGRMEVRGIAREFRFEGEMEFAR